MEKWRFVQVPHLVGEKLGKMREKVLATYILWCARKSRRGKFWGKERERERKKRESELDDGLGSDRPRAPAFDPLANGQLATTSGGRGRLRVRSLPSGG